MNAAAKLKATVLRQVEVGRRALIEDGRLVCVTARIHGDVFVREVLERDVEWMPGKFADRESEMFILSGDTPVKELR